MVQLLVGFGETNDSGTRAESPHKATLV
jgi:hypothetical protein